MLNALIYLSLFTVIVTLGIVLLPLLLLMLMIYAMGALFLVL